MPVRIKETMYPAAVIQEKRLSFDSIDALLQNSPDFIMNVNASGDIVYVNRGLPGFTKEEVIGSRFEQYTDPAYADEFNQRIVQAFSSKTAESIIVKGREPYNGVAWYEVRFIPVIRNFIAESVMLLVTDITQKVEAEEALAVSESKYRLLAEHMSDFVWVVDRDLKFTYLSPSIKPLLGYEISSIIGTSWLDLLTEQAKDVLEENLGQLAGGCSDAYRLPDITLELEFKTRSGSSIFTETKISLLRNEINFAQGFLGITRDITKRKEAEQALKLANIGLEHSNRELEQFAYAASHDLREPLRMVSEFMLLLQKRFENVLPSEARDYIQYALDGARRMKTLIDDLLDLSRVSTAGRAFKHVSLDTILDTVLRDLTFMIQDTNTRVKRTPLPVVWGDSIQLAQVFQNLIANAIKFSDKKTPVITISSTTEDRKCVLVVEDNGPGFDKKYSSSIFNIFERLPSEKEVRGNGIGLAMCKKIIERHNGTIKALPEPDCGAIFIVTLPKPGDNDS